MPFFYDQAHFAAVATALLAGDVQAEVRNGAALNSRAIKVGLIDGSTVLWSNQGKTWACSIVNPASDQKGEVVTHKSDMPHDADPEAVATMIATWDYGVAVEPVVEGG